jgi:hypothetical protein
MPRHIKCPDGGLEKPAISPDPIRYTGNRENKAPATILAGVLILGEQFFTHSRIRS